MCVPIPNFLFKKYLRPFNLSNNVGKYLLVTLLDSISNTVNDINNYVDLSFSSPIRVHATDVCY